MKTYWILEYLELFLLGLILLYLYIIRYYTIHFIFAAEHVKRKRNLCFYESELWVETTMCLVYTSLTNYGNYDNLAEHQMLVFPK